MWPDYSDIISRLGPPLWWEGHGIPRYDPFRPGMLGIYDHMAALIELACQGCDNRFMVGLGRQSHRMWPEVRAINPPTVDAAGDWHYGDPPRHNRDGSLDSDRGWSDDERGAGHCTGTTMNSYPIRIVEFWTRQLGDEWIRQPQHEFTFPEEENNDDS